MVSGVKDHWSVDVWPLSVHEPKLFKINPVELPERLQLATGPTPSGVEFLFENCQRIIHHSRGVKVHQTLSNGNINHSIN